MQLVMICKALPIGMQDVLGRGECDYRVSAKDGLAFFKWQDNKPLYVLSNFHGTEVSWVNRTQKDGTKRKFTSPMAVAHYNKYMGGVDKAKKWWHRIFFGILDQTVINAQIVYSKLEEKVVSVFELQKNSCTSIDNTCNSSESWTPKFITCHICSS